MYIIPTSPLSLYSDYSLVYHVKKHAFTYFIHRDRLQNGELPFELNKLNTNYWQKLPY